MKRLSDRRITEMSESTVNPMDGLGNLADAMLVLALGILLALILNWKVDISAVQTPEAAPPEDSAPIAVNAEDVTEAPDTVDVANMERAGTLYYDAASGMYYAVAEADHPGSAD